MSKSANVAYVDFQKKKSVTERDIYNSWYDKWLDIKRACDPSKTIVHEAITFIAAIEFLFIKNPDEIIFDKELLKKKCKQGPRQRSRFLVQLADLYEITPRTSYYYKGKKYHYVYSAKRTKNSLEILQNPKEFYKKSLIKLVINPDKNVLETSQKCLHTKTNLSASYIDNRNLIEEDKNSSKSFLSSKNIILKQENNNIITPAREADSELHEKNVQLTINAPSAFSSPAEQAQDASKVPKADSIPANNNEIYEKATMDEKAPLTASDRKMLLSKALLSAFGKEDADLLQDDCEFIELEADKVKITIGSRKTLNDLEKEKIRKSLKSVYGEEVRIVTGKRETQPESVTNCSRLTQAQVVTNCDKLSQLPTPELLTNVRSNNSEWLTFRKNLIRVLTKRHEEKIAQHIVKNWFDRLGISELSGHSRLVLIADPFYIHWIENNYDSVVEDAVCLSSFTVELHYKGNNERPRIYSKELIKRGKK